MEMCENAETKVTPTSSGDDATRARTHSDLAADKNFQKDDVVTVSGIKSASHTQYNGQKGKIVGPYGKEGRWNVFFELDEKTIALKPDNLTKTRTKGPIAKAVA